MILMVCSLLCGIRVLLCRANTEILFNVLREFLIAPKRYLDENPGTTGVRALTKSGFGVLVKCTPTKYGKNH